MSYLVIAYPELAKNDFDSIQNYRKQNDQSLFDVVDPHFTFIFPVNDFTEREFIDEIKLQSADSELIRFNIKCAIINKDAFNEYYHVFLVPDKGYNDIMKLHDKLYSGRLKSNLNSGIAFIPHITIGNSADMDLCKAMADEWNGQSFSISGVISQLSIIKYENNAVMLIEKIELKR